MASADPWTFAAMAERDYLTPEDIGDSVAAGMSREAIYFHTLEAISKGKAEDPRCCAFVAVHSDNWKARGRVPNESEEP